MLLVHGRRGSLAAVLAAAPLALVACASELGTSETGADDVSASGPTETLPPTTIPATTTSAGPTSSQDGATTEPPATGDAAGGGGPTTTVRPARPPPALPVQTGIVVPTGPPPQPPVEIEQATVSTARNPTVPEQQLLAAIGTALTNQAERVYYLETPKSLEVGKPAPLILGLKDPVRLPRRVMALADGRTMLGIEMAILPYGRPSMRFEEQSGPAKFVLDFPSRTLDALAPTGELARFDVTADETGTHGVWVVLANPRLGESEVDYSLSVPLREVSVADEGLTTRVVALLMAAAGIFGAITTVFVKPGRGLWSIRRRLGGQNSAAGREGHAGPRDRT